MDAEAGKDALATFNQIWESTFESCLRGKTRQIGVEQESSQAPAESHRKMTKNAMETITVSPVWDQRPQGNKLSLKKKKKGQ